MMDWVTLGPPPVYCRKCGRKMQLKGEWLECPLWHNFRGLFGAAYRGHDMQRVVIPPLPNRYDAHTGEKVA